MKKKINGTIAVPTAKTDPDGLTPKERRFVSHYMVDRNATRAFKLAKYAYRTEEAAGVMACKLVAKARISAAIARLERMQLDRAEAKFEISSDRVLREYARIAFADARDLYRADGSLKEPHEWDDNVASIISSVDVEERWDDDGVLEGHNKKVRCWDKISALDKLCKHLNICFDRHKVEVSGQVTHEHQLSLQAVLDALPEEALLKLKEVRQMAKQLEHRPASETVIEGRKEDDQAGRAEAS